MKGIGLLAGFLAAFFLAGFFFAIFFPFFAGFFFAAFFAFFFAMRSTPSHSYALVQGLKKDKQMLVSGGFPVNTKPR
jgi:multidrug efflux pump subunit AcrB